MSNLSEGYEAPLEDVTSDKPSTKPWLLAIGAGVTLLLLLVTYLIWERQTDAPPIAQEPPGFRESLQMSVSGEDHKPLEDFVVAQIAGGKNDAVTKSALYWIKHRFFDNDGNIYEIYDFINNNPELHFLKEAELIYPDIFRRVKSRQVPSSFGPEPVLAMLAYYQTLDKHGYADIAIWGVVANLYADLAYQSKLAYEANKLTGRDQGNTVATLEHMQRKSVLFLEKTNDWLIQNTRETGTLEDLKHLEMIPDSLLVGLNQHNSAIEQLRGSGIDFTTAYSTNDIYEFSYDLASELVPRLYFFTNYVRAYSLVIGGTATPENVATPLSRAVRHVRETDPTQWRPSVYLIINSRNSSGTVGLYAPTAVRILANLNPDFKNLLTDKGWTEADFIQR